MIASVEVHRRIRHPRRSDLHVATWDFWQRVGAINRELRRSEENHAQPIDDVLPSRPLASSTLVSRSYDHDHST
jgi:hypothetical protein